MKDWEFRYLFERGMLEDAIIKENLIKDIEGGRKLTIYEGFDPTSPHLHFGHLISLRVLRWFQLNGHKVIFLIGDGTGLVGDPSGQSKQRELLTEEIVRQNMATYQDQASLVLDFKGENPVMVKRNAEWLLSLTLKDMIQLMSRITIQRLLERDMFQERLSKGDPLFYVETIYPLLQGYDSVVMKVDAEIGGRDQMFNMLVGRDLVREYLGKEKYVLLCPLLPGVDGRKMSKSYGNAINLTATPFEMYDMLMQVLDELVPLYLRLITTLPEEEIIRVEKEMKKTPLTTKEILPYTIVSEFFGEKEARWCSEEFHRVRMKSELPSELPIAYVDEERIPDEVLLIDLIHLSEIKNKPSKSELRRLIQQKGIYLDGKCVEDIAFSIKKSDIDGRILKIGKKIFYQFKVKER